MSGRTRSFVWNYFEQTGNTFAICNICNHKLSYKSTISNLKKHLQRHPDINIPWIKIETMENESDLEESTTYDSLLSQKRIKLSTSIKSESFSEPDELAEYEEMETEGDKDDTFLTSGRRARRSVLWNYFTRLDDVYALCSLCQLKISYKTTTANLKRHMKRRHPTINIETGVEIDAIQNSLENSSETIYKHKTMRSSLWNYFTPLDDHYALCDLCKQKLSYKSTSSNLRKHLTLKHPTTFITFARGDEEEHFEVAEQSAEDEKAVQVKKLLETTEDEKNKLQISISKKLIMNHKKKIDACLLNLFTLDYQPCSIVEDEGFRNFVSTLNPTYQLPTRKEITQVMLPKAYEECLTKVYNKMNIVKSVCLTVDYWASVNESYIAITAHYISEMFKLESVLLECALLDKSHTSMGVSSEIKRITDEFNLSDKVLLVVTDNNSILKNAIVNELKWNHFECYGNSLNEIVNDALKLIKPLHDKVKLIIAQFRKSTIATEQLLRFQKDCGVMNPKKLLQDISICWNSTLRMLERFCELKDAVTTTIDLIDDLPNLSDEEWKICSQICKVLKPLEQVSKFNENQYIPASQVIVLNTGLTSVYNKLITQNFHQNVNDVINKLRSQIAIKFQNIQNNEYIATCTFLDPRFKTIGFSDKNSAENIRSLVVQLASNELEWQLSNDAISDGAAISDNKNEEMSIWEDFDNIIATSQPQKNTFSRAMGEIQRYLDDQILPRDQDPFLWWQQNQNLYRNLSKVVMEHFHVVATSVPCDRIFSKAGTIFNEKRTRFTTQKMKMLMFLNVNNSIQ